MDANIGIAGNEVDQSSCVYIQEDLFKSPSSIKLKVDWMRPLETTLSPSSTLSPEFSDLSVGTDSARKRRGRSPGLLGTSCEHRARKPRPNPPSKSPTPSPIRKFLKAKGPVAKVVDLFKDPTKGVRLAIGGRLKSSTVTGGCILTYEAFEIRIAGQGTAIAVSHLQEHHTSAWYAVFSITNWLCRHAYPS